MTDTDMPLGSNSINTPEAVQMIRSFATRVRNLETERAAINEDIREIFLEAKSHGFDTKILRQAIKASEDAAEYMEHRTILDMYCRALGMNL